MSLIVVAKRVGADQRCFCLETGVARTDVRVNARVQRGAIAGAKVGNADLEVGPSRKSRQRGSLLSFTFTSPPSDFTMTACQHQRGGYYEPIGYFDSAEKGARAWDKRATELGYASELALRKPDFS